MKLLSQRNVRAATLFAALVIAAGVIVLSVDYTRARLKELRDEQRIAAMQEKVREDASLAPRLEADKKAVADYYRARRGRINFLAYLLIAASAGFLSGAKWLIRRRGPAKTSAGPTGEAPGGGADDRFLSAFRPGEHCAWQATANDGPPHLLSEVPAYTESSQLPKNRMVCSTVDLAAVDAIIAREGTSAEAAIPILQAIQAHFRYLPEEALRRVCETTGITPAQIAGTSSFYARFRRSPVGEHIVRVCHGTACHVAGARQITDELRRSLAIPEGADTDPSRTFTIEEVACLGCCSLAPVLMVDDRTAGKLRPATARGALDAVRPEVSA